MSTIASLFSPDLAELLVPLRWPLTFCYVFLIALIGTYGLHRYWLVFLFNRHRKQVARPATRFEELPRVTIQLPMFNEGFVAERIIDAACKIDYPADRLQIQVLDDSTDQSKLICADRVEYWKAKGVDIMFRHRVDRTGYKAGALQEAMPEATGELIAIFDADFIPPANFLKRTVHHFTDDKVGMVQTRWAHLNRKDSLLTRGQAIFLDGHFVVEHTARNRSGAWINFNGTAGLWRAAAIEEAGGWQHDTLTEDVDLSYRAQLKGWKFLFLPQVTCPAELPPEINAFKSQQHRWTKGSIQTAIKLLPTLFRAKVPLHIKLEAFFHLTSPMVYLYISLFALLFFPAVYVNVQPLEDGTWAGVFLGISLFMLGTASATAFYITSQRAQKRSGWLTLLQVPMLMSIGIGIALNNAIACLEALLGHESPFIRTPKYGDNLGTTEPGETETAPITPHNDAKPKPAKSKLSVIPIPSLKLWITFIEIAFGLLMVYCGILSVQPGNLNSAVSLPFLMLFASGYLYVGLNSLAIHARGWLAARQQKRSARLAAA
ncbi:cellulose synthase family protein [Algisphaera agarilytica]|uniref:Cellulose synthase/poly-beta-1,6-N-acetylglucosamine synthase-like glycosyltransferase n=1 Tax=Algisphaera agarilytica TaxID=1385975 RepID=A0A7X0HAD9_9BACT|nr:cellulose synthase family protein [Algisphaera agarilytica]MBB6430765.1 cellulose synthase/poly-beta-1,6-N-acetylglucosamine synthase-like glycosyltransferase [Algisphaera agarilytica]